MRIGRLGVCALVAAGGISGCRAIPLADDPMTSVPTRMAPEVFRVDWWESLVGQVKLLEHAPREVAAPAFDPERDLVYTLTRDGMVRALGPGGERRWEHATGSFFSAGPGVSRHTLYLPGGNGKLIALDPESGKEKWTYASGEELASAPIEQDGVVLVASHSNTLFAVDASSGAWKWQYRREIPAGFTIRGVSSPVVRDGVAYIGFSDGVLVALRVSDGVALWERQLSTSAGPFIDVDTTPVFDDAGHLFAASVKDGVSSLDPATGTVLWTRKVQGVSSLVAQGEVLFATGSGQIAALMAADGAPLWNLPIGDEAAGQPVLSEGYLVAPTVRGLLFVDPALGRTVLRWDPGQGVSSSVAQGRAGTVYALSNMGFIYALDLVGSQG